MSTPQVVIVRKDKRIRHKFTHLLAFGLLSGAVTAAEALNHAGYNRRTRQLQAGTSSPQRRKSKVELTDEERAYLAEHVPSEYRRH